MSKKANKQATIDTPKVDALHTKPLYMPDTKDNPIIKIIKKSIIFNNNTSDITP